MSARWIALFTLTAVLAAGPNAAATAPLWALADDSRVAHRSGPGSSGFSALPGGTVFRLEPATGTLRSGPGGTLSLALPGRAALDLEIRHTVEHGAGHRTLVADDAGHGVGDRAIVTSGPEGLFARITTSGGVYLAHTDATGSWLVDLGDPRLEVDRLDHDTLGEPADLPQAVASPGPAKLIQIDMMFVYTPDMLERYPGSLIDTRLNHLVAVANQAMADSEVAIVVRLVHHRVVNYTQSQRNFEALGDLRDALAGVPVPGLEGLVADRNEFGADIVALTWPHDIETRGSCGVAFFPGPPESPDPSRGVHITNDGVSNWSICSDAVFTHELGHNLNARHQRTPNDPPGVNFAFVRDRHFHTIMGSFGSANVNRFLRLDVFSNPAVACDGTPCGTMFPGREANNAREVGEWAPVIAGYRPSQVPGMAGQPPPAALQLVNTPPEAPPPADFEPRKLRPGEILSDWELLVASSASDQVLSFTPGGEFRGIAAAPEQVDPFPILTEFTDIDVDDSGLLYMLASADVRRYDRQDGRLVDVWLDSAQPEPMELLSAFPRAMGFAPNGDLVVLGDSAVERFDAGGNRLNQPRTGNARDPEDWNVTMELALRAFAFGPDGRFYLAEATDNRMLVFDATSGARLPDLVGPGNDLVTDPWSLAFGDDGHLYVANGRAGNVLRFDIESGDLVDVFVAAGAGGLGFARSLAFGPAGGLYVACRESHAVLRFDATTGDYLDTPVEPGEQGLQGPENLLFTRALSAVQPGHGGQFYDPARSGEGWLIEVLEDDRAVAIWFTYPPPDSTGGEQAWLVGVGEVDDNRILIDSVISTRGGEFGPGFDFQAVERIPWGGFEFEFVDCASGILTYQGPPEFGAATRAFTRLSGIDGLPCDRPPRGASPDAPGISGQWYDPAHSGEGWFLQEFAPGRVLMAWFTYDHQGDQAWLVGVGEMSGDTASFPELVMPRGTVFGEDFDPAAVERNFWGEATLQFADCNSARLDYASALPRFGSGRLDPVRLTRLAGAECRIGE